MYFYTEEGVYRKSNHWGRVANCRWKMIANEDLQEPSKPGLALPSGHDFYPIHSNRKRYFFIDSQL